MAQLIFSHELKGDAPPGLAATLQARLRQEGWEVVAGEEGMSTMTRPAPAGGDDQARVLAACQGLKHVLQPLLAGSAAFVEGAMRLEHAFLALLHISATRAKVYHMDPRKGWVVH